MPTSSSSSKGADVPAGIRSSVGVGSSSSSATRATPEHPPDELILLEIQVDHLRRRLPARPRGEPARGGRSALRGHVDTRYSLADIGDSAGKAEGASGARSERHHLVMRYGVTLQGVYEPAEWVELVQVSGSSGSTTSGSPTRPRTRATATSTRRSRWRPRRRSPLGQAVTNPLTRHPASPQPSARSGSSRRGESPAGGVGDRPLYELGLPMAKLAALRESIDVMRRLWRGPGGGRGRSLAVRGRNISARPSTSRRFSFRKAAERSRTDRGSRRRSDSARWPFPEGAGSPGSTSRVAICRAGGRQLRRDAASSTARSPTTRPRRSRVGDARFQLVPEDGARLRAGWRG